MLKFNKDMFERFMGSLAVLIIMINILFPVAGIIAGALLLSKNYFSLILIFLGIIIAAYLLAIYEGYKMMLKRALN